jgi:plasmid replication initiation protein
MNINKQIETILMIKSSDKKISSISLNEFLKFENGSKSKAYCLIINYNRKKDNIFKQWFNNKIKLLEWLVADYEKSKRK